MTKTMRRRLGAMLLALSASVGLALGFASPAQADGDRQVLMLDPYAHCAWHKPFGLQQQELGWSVDSAGPRGTRGENDWECLYGISGLSIPTGLRGSKNVGADDANYSLDGASISYPVPIDWSQMCKDQYGDSAEIWWVGKTPGPVVNGKGAMGSPWQCMGAPGRHYDLYDINEKPDSVKGWLERKLDD